MTTNPFSVLRFLRTFWLVLLFLLVPGNARANVGPPMTGGQVVAEPLGLVDVDIARETLTIDLRPLAAEGLAEVTAVYHLDNRGPTKKLDLLFAAGGLEPTEFQVFLGDQPVATTVAEKMAFPAGWQPPKVTPGIQEPTSLAFNPRGKGEKPQAFTLTVPPGRHDLKVRYLAEAALHRFGNPTVYRQFVYVLAPARAWARFGGLDVTIHLPEGWRAAWTPDLTRQDDTLVGNFADLPADAIALTVQAPEGPFFLPLRWLTLILLGLTVLGGLVICWRCGVKEGRRLSSLTDPGGSWLVRHAWPKSLGLGIAWGLAIYGIGFCAIFAPDWTLPSGQVNHYGYGQIFAVIGVILLSILAVPFGFLIAQISAVFNYHR